MPTYRPSKERIGLLNERPIFFSPVRTYTVHGGQRIVWIEWLTTWAKVENQRGSEAVESDRPTALNTKRLIVRAESVPNVNETMVFQLHGDTYDIERIDRLEDSPRNQYLEITGTRRGENLTAVEFLANELYMDFAQRFTDITANYITVSAGTILSTTTYTEAQINQLLFVFRNGLRLSYGATGDDGFTINNGTNRITPNQKLRGENLLVHQYQITA